MLLSKHIVSLFNCVQFYNLYSLASGDMECFLCPQGRDMEENLLPYGRELGHYILKLSNASWLSGGGGMAQLELSGTLYQQPTR